MEWSSIKQNIVFKKWDPVLVELRHPRWGGEVTSNDASQGSRPTGECRDPCIAMTGWTSYYFEIFSYKTDWLLRWSVAVRRVRAGSLTCWRPRLVEPPLVSTGGRSRVIWGSPADTEVEIQSLPERKLEHSPRLARIKDGRTRNMKIPTVNTSQSILLWSSVFR